MLSFWQWALPWDFSPTVLVCCLAALLLFMRGARQQAREGAPVARWRQLSFYTGLALLYVPLQTGYDYLAQHMFWMHRLQHFMLHDCASLLVALAAPWGLIARGLPVRHAGSPGRWLREAGARTYRLLSAPLPAYVLFVGLIYLWLWPSIHFRAMLSLTEYKCMNWSVALDGLLFWSLILDPRSREQGARMAFGPRIFLALLTMIPETIIGAFLSLHTHTVYTVYDICGRLWSIDSVTDQQLGGLIIWIPASMMCSFAALVTLRRWMREDTRLQRAAAERAVTAVTLSA
jgi:putative membrane protein